MKLLPEHDGCYCTAGAKLYGGEEDKCLYCRLNNEEEE